MARHVPLHTATAGSGKGVIGRGATRGIKIRAAGYMVYTNEGMKKCFAYVEAWSSHCHIVVKSEVPQGDDGKGLIIAAEIGFPSHPPVYMDRHRPLEAGYILARRQATCTRVQIRHSTESFQAGYILFITQRRKGRKRCCRRLRLLLHLRLRP